MGVLSRLCSCSPAGTQSKHPAADATRCRYVRPAAAGGVAGQGGEDILLDEFENLGLHCDPATQVCVLLCDWACACACHDCACPHGPMLPLPHTRHCRRATALLVAVRLLGPNSNPHCSC